MTITVGDKGQDIAVQFLDQNGAVMTGVVTDAPPAWTQSDPTIDTLTVAADGLSAHDDGLKAGSDTISVIAMVGGVSFPGSIVSDVVDAAPRLTSINLVATPTP